MKHLLALAAAAAIGLIVGAWLMIELLDRLFGGDGVKLSVDHRRLLDLDEEDWP